MKDLDGLTEKELLRLTLLEQKRIRADFKDFKKEDFKPLKDTVEKHEKFKNTLVGAMTISIVGSVTAFFKAIFG